MTEVKRSKPNVVHWLVLADSHGIRIDRNGLCVLCIHVDSPDLVCTKPGRSTVPVLLSTFQLFKVHRLDTEQPRTLLPSQDTRVAKSAAARPSSNRCIDAVFA